MTYSLRLPRGFIAACLASLYILGFILTPYWRLHGSPAEIVFYLALTLGLGLAWLLLSTNSLQVEFSLPEAGIFLLLLIALAGLNYRPLNAVIPFRGDEALHIERTMEVAGRVSLLPGAALLAGFMVFLLAGLKNQKWLIVVGISLVTGIVLYFLGDHLFKDMEEHPLFFLRYPFFNYWLFAVVPELVAPISSPYHEVLYRVIPFLAMVGTAWLIPQRTGTSHLLTRLAWGLAVATLPLVFYYSSILYLEPLAVLLMTIACLDIHSLLHKSSREISRTPSWYALLLIGFIKETALPFLLCFLAIRMVVQLRTWLQENLVERSARTLLNLLAGELGMILVVIAPAFLYLYFRTALTTTRSFVPNPANVLDLVNYRFVFLSFLEQFGVFFFFFLAGCVLLIRNRDFTPVLFYFAILLAVPTFHIIDNEVYAGYSRFNLFVLPPILAGSTWLVAWAAGQKKYVGGALALLAIASNLLLAPVHWDGVKTPYWGNYRVDDSDHYYPYQDAFVWLKANTPNKRMLFTGLDFYYPFSFYWNKLDWKPKRDGMLSEGIADETLAMSSLLEKAERENYGVVVYRVLGKDPALPEETGKFRVQVVENSAHSLIIFYKP